MKTTKVIEVLSDDLTGKEITKGGWVLKGIKKPEREYHFAGLSELLVALRDNATILGMSADDTLIFLAETLKHRRAEA